MINALQQCAIKSMLLPLWSKHRAITLHQDLNITPPTESSYRYFTEKHLTQQSSGASIELILNVIATLLSLTNVSQYLFIYILQTNILL